MQMQQIELDNVAFASDTDTMRCKCNKQPRVTVYLAFSEEETAKFRTYLQATGRKAGPWMRTLALRAMDDDKARSEP